MADLSTKALCAEFCSLRVMVGHRQDHSCACVEYIVYRRAVDAAAISSNYEWVSKRSIHLLLTHHRTQTAEHRGGEKRRLCLSKWHTSFIFRDFFFWFRVCVWYSWNELALVLPPFNQHNREAGRRTSRFYLHCVTKKTLCDKIWKKQKREINNHMWFMRKKKGCVVVGGMEKKPWKGPLKTSLKTNKIRVKFKTTSKRQNCTV